MGEALEWMAYERVEPFGEARGDIQAAIVASMIANANRDSKKQRKPFSFDKFMLDFWQERQKASAKSMRERFMAYALSHNQAINQAAGRHGENH